MIIKTRVIALLQLNIELGVKAYGTHLLRRTPGIKRRPLMHMVTATDAYRLASHPSRLFRAEDSHHIRNIFWLPKGSVEFAQRITFKYLFPLLLNGLFPYDSSIPLLMCLAHSAPVDPAETAFTFIPYCQPPVLMFE